MPTAQIRRLVGVAQINPGSRVFIELPRSNYLGAIELLIEPVVGGDSGNVTIVDSTLGPIPLIEHVQLTLDGHQVPLAVSGRELDIWSHIDRPGSERLATSSTTRAKTWQAVLRYELAQSVQNLLGALPLFGIASATLEIEFAAATKIATATGLSVGGNVRVSAEMYDQSRGLAIETNVVHTLRRIQQPITQSGDVHVELPTGRFLERLIAVAWNSGSPTWTLLDGWTLSAAQGDEPYDEPTVQVRARQLRNYGGDNVPMDGVYVWDFRRGGDRDIIALGNAAVAPDPEVVLKVGSGTLTNARVDFLLEELEAAPARA